MKTKTRIKNQKERNSPETREKKRERMRDERSQRKKGGEIPDGDGVYGHGVGSGFVSRYVLVLACWVLGRGRQVIIFKSFFLFF